MEDPDSAWLSDVLSDSSTLINGKYFKVKTTFEVPQFSSDSADYKRLISLLLGSYHAHMTEKKVKYKDEDKIAKTVDRIGGYLEIMEQCLKPFVSQVKGARMSDSNTAGIPEKKDVTFKIIDGKSLGHVHCIIFWNDKQVRIIIILTLLTGVFLASSHQLLEQDPAPWQQGTGHSSVPGDHR